MSIKYKLILLLSNLCLIALGLNIFLKFIDFGTSRINSILIAVFCLMNIVVALFASFEAANKK